LLAGQAAGRDFIRKSLRRATHWAGDGEMWHEVDL